MEDGKTPETVTAPAPPAEKPRPRHEIQYTHRNTADKILHTKKKHRTDISWHKWDASDYASSDFCKRALKRGGTGVPNTIQLDRIHRKHVTPEQFFSQYAAPQRPCIVEGCMDDWPAYRDGTWAPSELEQRFRHVEFKCGQDDSGRKLRMKMKYFYDYLKAQKDDSPLYLFESSFHDAGRIHTLMDEFKVPDFFPADLFNLVGRDRKPPYRWFCIGPERSGSTVHIDPLGTAAWNSVTSGYKLWVLFEPAVARKLAKGKEFVKEGEDDEAIMYFDFILPRIREAHPDLRIYEVLQKPGDTIFVPGNWWHGVVNLADTVAVTQNYCGFDNFDMVWCKTRKDRKKLAVRWLASMQRFMPELYARARSLNQRDGFVMYNERQAGDASSSSDSSSSSSSTETSEDDEDIDFTGLRDSLQLRTWSHVNSCDPPGVHKATSPSPGRTARTSNGYANGHGRMNGHSNGHPHPPSNGVTQPAKRSRNDSA